MTKITLAKTAGFCFGVDRAIKIIENLVAQGKSVSTLGPIIHNEQVIEELSNKGVRVVCEPEEAKSSVLVLRAHGVTKDVLKRLEQSGVEFVDAACPFVKKIHKTVIENSNENTVTIIAGDPDHPEVKGIKSYAFGESFVVRNESEL